MLSLRHGGAVMCVLVSYTPTVRGDEQGLPVREFVLAEQATECVAFSPDGRRLAVGGLLPAPSEGDVPAERRLNEGIVVILDAATGKTLARRDFSGKRMPVGGGRSDTANIVKRVRFSPDGKRLAVADFLGTYLWDPEEGTVREIEEARMPGSVVFSRNGKLLAANGKGTISVRDVDTLKPKWTKTAEGGGAGLNFSHDGKLLASAERANRIHLWDVVSGEQLAEDHAMMGSLYDVAFASDDKSLAAVGEGGAAVWDIKRGAEKFSLERRIDLAGHLSSVNFVNFSPDGKLLATSSRDKSLKVWDTVTGRQLATVLFRFGVGEAVFSPDGKSLAAGGARDRNGNDPVPLLLVWKLEDLLDPNTVKARAKEAVAELFRLAVTGKPEEAFRQLAGIEPAPETTVPLLVEGLESQHAEVRSWAETALDIVAKTATAPELRKLLMDEHPQVRQFAGRVLESRESRKK
jgi:WD40 repeat protein